MTLPTDFQFSQSSLQDYADCPRRFYLRYVRRLAWPAVRAEPVLKHERHLQQGVAFHRLIHQHLLGLPPQRLSSTVTEEDLNRWWRNYLHSGPSDLPPRRYPEVTMSVPLNGHRLVAKYDLIAVQPGERAVIADWKTYRRPIRRSWLAEQLQTRVYPYLLVRAGSHLNEGQPWRPEQVEMVYWFANFPQDPERFLYDRAQYDSDGEYLAGLIEEIKGLGDADFPLTSERRRCGHCPYRSLCQRGVRAGGFEEADEESDLGGEFDIFVELEQVGEIEY